MKHALLFILALPLAGQELKDCLDIDLRSNAYPNEKEFAAVVEKIKAGGNY